MARSAPSESDVTAFVEGMARDTAIEGFPRIAGRIFGLLLVSEAPLCLGAIAERLQVSKGSISADARSLEQRGILERVTVPGDRRDYYRVPDDLFVRTVRLRLARWQAFHRAIARGRTVLPANGGAARRRIDSLDTGFRFVTAALEDALARWERRERRGTAARSRR